MRKGHPGEEKQKINKPVKKQGLDQVVEKCPNTRLTKS